MRRTITKIEITLLKREQTAMRLRAPRVGWCAGCAAQAQLVSTDEAAALTQTTARAIFRRVEMGQLHFVESASGALLVCCASLGLKQHEAGGGE